MQNTPENFEKLLTIVKNSAKKGNKEAKKALCQFPVLKQLAHNSSLIVLFFNEYDGCRVNADNMTVGPIESWCPATDKDWQPYGGDST